MKRWSVVAVPDKQLVRVALDGPHSVITFDADEAREIAVRILRAAAETEDPERSEARSIAAATRQAIEWTKGK